MRAEAFIVTAHPIMFKTKSLKLQIVICHYRNKYVTILATGMMKIFKQRTMLVCMYIHYNAINFDMKII